MKRLLLTGTIDGFDGLTRISKSEGYVPGLYWIEFCGFVSEILSFYSVFDNFLSFCPLCRQLSFQNWCVLAFKRVFEDCVL